ncbi:hypothetical protein [Olsenella porci]|uniref:Uncharacterized protein n=1 Tax=Olsenella porci TaxID=2652279 RepID=A0A6N7XA78_9ACTN|nr:hypothetical protein [Olsenella porci]MST72442.1 hypothetical protein [Olsenella porci]
MQNEGATQGFRDDPLAEPVRWWRRSPANTSTLSKAVCVMAASFALTAVLGGTYPTHALAVDETGGQAAVASADSDGADSAASAHGPTDVGSSGEGAVGAAHVTTATEGSSAESDDGTGSRGVAFSSTDQRRQTMGATVSQTAETHVEALREEAETSTPASLSVAAAYVSEERDEDSDDATAPKGQDDGTDSNATAGSEGTRQIADAVITSTMGKSPAVEVSGGTSLAAVRSTVVSVAPGDGADVVAVAADGASSVSLGEGSTASARGVRSVAVSATGSGTTATLSDASAYASGSGCAALQAADGASVIMTGGSLEATGGTALRAEGEGSSIRVSGAQVLSHASLAELAGDVAVELSGVESTSEHAPAVYVAAGVPTLRLTNGTVVHGSVVLAGEADIDIQTDSTSRLDGSIVRVA